MEHVTVSTKGWVVIPARHRAKYGLAPGSRLRVIDYGGVLALVPVSGDPIRKARGMLKSGTSLTRTLLAEHRRERARGVRT